MTDYLERRPFVHICLLHRRIGFDRHIAEDLIEGNRPGDL